MPFVCHICSSKNLLGWRYQRPDLYIDTMHKFRNHISQLMISLILINKPVQHEMWKSKCQDFIESFGIPVESS